MPMKSFLSLLRTTGCAAVLLLSNQYVMGFDYGLVGAGDISLTDTETGIGDIQTIFVNEDVAVSVTGIEWEPSSSNATGSHTLFWETFVGGVKASEGTFDLSDLAGRELVDSLDCGSVNIPKNGRHEISVKLFVDDTEASTSGEYEAFRAGTAIIPLLVVLVLAMTTQMVEFSLFFAIFVGACMVAGGLQDGFKLLLEDYILNALSDVGHGYVYLFSLFLSGLVGMMEKSGGMIGFTKVVSKYATSSRAGQCATFVIGCVIFFDDYANTLLAGETMRPLTDMLFVSREKLSFIVDATAAPVASLTPISSWVGFEVGLIQTEIDRIVEMYGVENVTIKTSGMAVFLQSIKYRYYPIFIMILIPLLIFSKRDFGPMLIAERKTQVYERTDGGDGAGNGSKYGVGPEPEGSKHETENAPRLDTPTRFWNMLIPIALLVFFIFYLLVKSGDDGSGTQTVMQKIESSDSYAALLFGTMAVVMLTSLLYMVQIVQNGQLVIPSVPVFKALLIPSSDVQPAQGAKDTNEAAESNEEAEETAKIIEQEQPGTSSRPRLLMSLYDILEAFLYGMGRIFPALIVLTLAWASGSAMVAVGADRLFSRWIVGGVSADALPTLSFIISLLMALATGTSWGTMSILFPLICLPTYTVSDGDPIIFYSTVAGILSGSVAGDHISPISDTTVLSALASDCNLLAHVVTQAPYSLLMSLVAILFGTLPIGRGAWPNAVGIVLGALVNVAIVYGLGVPVLNPTGRFDIFTHAYMKLKGEGSSLHILQEDTIKYCEGNAVSDEEEIPAEERVEKPTQIGKEKEQPTEELKPTERMNVSDEIELVA